MKLIGKVKGRGYFAGIKSKDYRVKRSAEEIANFNKKNSGVYWGYEYEWKKKYIYVFKRNISDIPDFCFFDNGIDDIKTYINEQVGDSEFDYSIIDSIKMEEYSPEKREKRVLRSKKSPYYSKQVLKLKTGGSHLTSFCTHCGTNIYDDEPKMVLSHPRIVICIHCLQPLLKDIQEATDNLPEKYEADYLLARSVDM